LSAWCRRRRIGATRAAARHLRCGTWSVLFTDVTRRTGVLSLDAFIGFVLHVWRGLLSHHWRQANGNNDCCKCDATHEFLLGLFPQQREKGSLAPKFFLIL
jgi:hypothetical protein